VQIDARHLGEAQQVDCHIRQFFRGVFTALAPRVECLGDLSLEQAELQRDIGRIEPFSDLVLPGQFLYRLDIHVPSAAVAGLSQSDNTVHALDRNQVILNHIHDPVAADP
jgi:hypothetical protein